MLEMIWSPIGSSVMWPQAKVSNFDFKFCSRCDWDVASDTDSSKGLSLVSFRRWCIWSTFCKGSIQGSW